MAGNDYAVSSDKRIERYHSEGGETVNKDVVVFPTKRIKNGLENELSVCEWCQCGAYAGQLLIGGDKIHAFSVVDNGFVRIDRSIHDDTVHEGSERKIETIEVMFTETYGQTALRICVHKEYGLISASETDSEVQSGRSLTNAALLVDDRDDFCLFHFGFVLSVLIMFD